MELNYQRCPEDEAKILTADIIVGQGKVVELGLPEIVTSLALKASIYSATLAIKNGVTEDFVSRVAVGLAHHMGGDIHALCPVMGMMMECFALMGGGHSTLDEEGLVDVFPRKECPPMLRGYFENRLEDE